MVTDVIVDFLTVPEAAEIMRISKLTLYRMVSSGQIKHVRICRRVFIKRADLESYIEDHTFGGKVSA